MNDNPPNSMNATLRRRLLPLFLIAVLAGLSACSSTRSEHGVTIEKNRSLNPLSYIPGL